MDSLAKSQENDGRIKTGETLIPGVRVRIARSNDDPLDAGNAAGLLVDGNGTILGCTPAAETLLHRRADDLCGRRVRDLLADPGRWRDVMAQRDGPVWEGRAVVREGGGGESEVMFRVLPLDRGQPDRQASRFFLLGAPWALVLKWRQDHAFMQELFLQERVGFAVFDRELRLVRTNTQLLPYTGVPPDLSGLRLAEFLWPEDARVIDEQLGKVLTTGTPLVAMDALVRTRVDPGRGRIMALSAFRLQESDGRVMGVTALFTDVTEQRGARERLDLLHRVTAVLGNSLSVAETTQDLADVLVPVLADLAAVDIAEAVFAHEEPGAEHQRHHVMRRAAVAGGAGAGRLPTGGSMRVDVGGGLRGRVWPRLAEQPSADAEGDTGADAWPGSLPGPGIHSAMSALLRARGRLLGRVTVWRDGDRAPFGADDLDLLEEIASRAALVVDNARRYARERHASVSLQRSLLPPMTTETAAVQSSSVYLPTDTAGGVSGDWFDVIPLSSARVALVVGDVVGHGLQATAMMGRLRTAVRTLADLDLEPDELLTHLDDLVSQLTVENSSYENGTQAPERRSAYDSFGATCLYVTYDPVSRQCAMASAGHPPPALVAPDGTVGYVDVSPGPPLGVGGLPFEPVEMEVEPGSVLALYTDGLVERPQADLDEGMAALKSRLAAADVLARPLREVGREVVADLAPSPLSDDVTLLLARTRGVPAQDSVMWVLEPDPAVVADARALVVGQLSRWDLDELVFTTELVASELVTNAIRYAGGGPVELKLIRTTTLICEVSDPSSTQPRMRRARATEEGGRGLFLIAQLTERWGSRYTRHGKTIWTEQTLPGAP
ncbi:SpoIIE family protein phosphatase [Streptomyces sp. ISL-96]|uniref:SpoIIE family protein phosphatase n=1 Tax=Streptomyces sp. ISL-96 TaxID=2819191 RepID=UPI001BE6A440|nr:SpoIIE family protein phosphatase [Streptomyces sp. ISL-96]MBT2490991.1 SpoIIE family protein phosphatase [Streptomyces sp. ISL-96]